MHEELFYCDTHQTLQDTPDCEVCLEQDGTSYNGQYAKTKNLDQFDRQSAWQKMAKENHRHLADKYKGSI